MATPHDSERSPKAAIDAAKAHAQHLFLDSAHHDQLVFHNYERCEEVVDVCADYIKDNELDDDAAHRLHMAAWLLFTGYFLDPHDPAPNSAAEARRFLSQHGYAGAEAGRIAGMIETVLTDGEPADELTQVLHDARWSFLGRKRFDRKQSLWRLEEQNLTGEEIYRFDWSKRMQELQMHKPFYTNWALEEFSSRRNKNLAELTEDMKKARKATERRKTGKEFGRGIDTVYRITLQNHIELSSIADGKANMIISINTLVLSILITAGSASFSMAKLTKLSDYTILVPVVILMITSLTAIIFAVLSAIPKVSSGNYRPEDARQHKVSLLYFGNFLKLGKEAFVDYLRDLKEDQEILYDDLSRDLYNLGAVLQKKYRLLKVSYWVFVGGLAISFLAFLLVFLSGISRAYGG